MHSLVAIMLQQFAGSKVRYGILENEHSLIPVLND